MALLKSLEPRTIDISSLISMMNLMEGSGNAMQNPTVYGIVQTKNGKVEPSLAYHRMSIGNESFSIMTFGLGIFRNKIDTKSFKTYFGGRVSITSYGGDGFRGEIFSIGPVSGAEYIFKNNFSIGGETQVIYTKPNQEEVFKTSFIEINCVIFFRFYR